MKEDHLYNSRFLSFSFLKYDIPAGLVVFLVALPLCLGIALASGAPPISGLITGIVGGILVSVLSGSQLSVSGPAAGLTVIVLTAIHTLGSFEVFLLAVLIAGILQLSLGLLKAGSVANYFPSSVIKGMLAAIGIILIIKQIPHAFGYDADYEGDFTFIENNGDNTFSSLITLMSKTHTGAIIIAALSLFILILWERPFMKKLKMIPSALIVVIAGILMNLFFRNMNGGTLALRENHLVQIPVMATVSELAGVLRLPDFKAITNIQVWITAGTLAIVASLESLLSLEAVDKLDPIKRVSPANKELIAQGIGNIVVGCLGGLPMTAVIVRSSANVNSGGKTKTASFVHGIFLFAAVLLLPTVINLIPLASLACILLMTGYKLSKVSLFKEMHKLGWEQFVPFAMTIIAIVFTDLLKGIAVGMALAAFYVLRRNMRHSFYFHTEKKPPQPTQLILAEEVSFLNKANIRLTLDELPEDSSIIIDGTKSRYIDYDVLEIIWEFSDKAHYRNINVELRAIPEVYHISAHA